MTRHRLERGLAAVTALVVAAAVWVRLGPLPVGLLEDRRQLSTTVVDRKGQVLYEARSEEGTRGTRLSLDELPPYLVSATIAAEDRRFYKHVGIDPVAIGRAMIHDVEAGAVVEGGSTITQQVAKLLIARRAEAEGRRRPSARGMAAKLYEAFVSLRLEHRLGKRAILALYLNLAPYGNQVSGAERASRVYFGVPAGLLTPAEAAFLAGLPQRPSTFNPYRDRRPALARQKRVIDRMAALGFLPPAAANQARAERLVFTREETPFVAPHFVEMVLAGFDEQRPLRVETTLDAELQGDVEGIIRSQRANLEQHRAHNVSVVVLKNDTGEWLAWEGSGDYLDASHGGAINGPLSPRQPGSALKPFTYALAFEEGRSPATVLPDVPSNFPTAEAGVVYSPRNYDGLYRGPLLIRRALAGSENVPAVAITAELGVPKLLRFLHTAGLSTFDKTAAYYGLGITLGNAEVRLAELVAAYSAIARGGTLRQPYSVRAVDFGQGRTSTQPATDVVPARLVSPRSAFWITDILSDPAAREFVFGRGGSLEFPFAVAVKTGTSQGYHDNWTIGYTREVTVGVWVGNFDRSPLANSSGVTGAGPIFHGVMLAAERRVAGQLRQADDPLAPVPGGVVRQPICALSGMRATAACPTSVNEWLPAEDAGLPCSWHHASDQGLLVVWPPVYRQWAQGRGLLGDERAPRIALVRDDVAAGEAGPQTPALHGQRFGIANPPPGAIYLIDPTLRREFQTLSLRALVDQNGGQIEWTIDGRSVGRAAPDTPLAWPLVPGSHRVQARDQRGRTAETTIVVK
ncbi:MAG TPA: penicillin-binding protein 1C [Vicinamibacterales bacterium]|nr:penicillin-binding protein 1C [Vicinamibacterales bacterium]